MLPEYGFHVSRDLALSERMVSSNFGEVSSSVAHFALFLKAARVKSVFLRHGICSTKSGASW